MSEVLQEFVDSGNQRLRVDRTAGIIRGVKLLGLASKNGRRYREAALTEAVALYEGAKVNINHPKGHPLAPRDYQDRLGTIRGVQFRAGDGLFGDLHFNPKHALSEQLTWDAEHAPQNVGMSHNVLARTKLDGNETVVEAITKVQSIDLVADPASTSGLYEHADSAARKAPDYADSIPGTWQELTVEHLQRNRPDLVREFEIATQSQVEEVRMQLDAMRACEEASRRREQVLQLLEQYGLPLPGKNGRPLQPVVSEQFMESLMTATDLPAARRLIEERAELIRSASAWNKDRSNGRRPQSREQLALNCGAAEPPVRGAKEFAAAVRGS